MRLNPNVLFVFAHPDDETFLSAGTMLALKDTGSHVAVVSATRGEEGEIAEGVPATRESLGEFREGELRAAMEVLGVEDIRFLDYRDSGMDGTDTNNAADAFMRVPVDEVGRRMLAVIDEFRPDLVIGFGPEGVYLHPDHIAAHKGVFKALELTDREAGHHRPDALLYATPPREWFVELGTIEGNPFAEMPPEFLAKMGVPADELTHVVDVHAYKDRILEALMCHASQFGAGDPFDWLPPHLEEKFVRYNHYKRAELPWGADVNLPDIFSRLN